MERCNICGIAGFIGRPKRPKASYNLITAIFHYLEIRGTDASGFYATEYSKNGSGKTFFDKAAIKSSEFIKNKSWSELSKSPLDMVLVHCRWTSKGGGPAYKNINNHPFLSEDKKLALAHNGTLDKESNFLKEKYQTLSDTDSEYLLRIYEAGLSKTSAEIHGLPRDVSQKITGIKDIWSYVSSGAMSVAIAEQIDDQSRGLFLFRNEKRPLWIADMRKSFGQIFFFSTPDIWYRSLMSNPQLKDFCWGSQKLIELPYSEIWYMKIDKEDSILTNENMFRIAVTVSDSGKEFEKGEYCKINNLSEDSSKLLKSKTEYFPKFQPPVSNNITPRSFKEKETYKESNDFEEPVVEVNKDLHTEICNGIKNTIDDITNNAYNLMMEGSMSQSKYTDLIESLEQTRCDLEGTLAILNG